MKKTNKIHEYLVHWRRESDSEWGLEYAQEFDAQGAADFVRKYCMPEDAEIITVAEIKKNWK